MHRESEIKKRVLSNDFHSTDNPRPHKPPGAAIPIAKARGITQVAAGGPERIFAIFAIVFPCSRLARVNVRETRAQSLRHLVHAKGGWR